MYDAPILGSKHDSSYLTRGGKPGDFTQDASYLLSTDIHLWSGRMGLAMGEKSRPCLKSFMWPIRTGISTIFAFP